MMTDCDTLFMIGSRFPYTEFLPEEGQARGVQIDLDPRMVSMRYPMEGQPDRGQQSDLTQAAAAART
jgi:thiamine pyrophosphate-dependent acetolactate synthase large subunit-like protein